MKRKDRLDLNAIERRARGVTTGDPFGTGPEEALALVARVRELEARVSLPVIATCGECKRCVAYGRPNAKPPKRGAVLTEAELARHVAFYACEHDASPRDETGVARVSGRADVPIPPPDWCPLRGSANKEI